MGVADLDAAKAARAEALGEQHIVRFGGTDFPLPMEIPFEFATAATKGDLDEAIGYLLGEDQFQEFMSHKPSMPDVEFMLTEATKLYGIEPGESPASRNSSVSTIDPLRQTSLASTNSI